MASNPVNWQNYNSIPAGTTTVSLGIAPGNLTPARILESFVTGALTITLPPIVGSLPQPPTTSQQTVGVAGGFEMTIFNTGGGTITTTPYNANGETDVSLPSTITITAAANKSVTLVAIASTQTWYVTATT